MRVLALDGDENAVLPRCVHSSAPVTASSSRRHAKAVQSWSLPLLRQNILSLRLPRIARPHFAAEVATEAAREPGTLIIAHTESTTVRFPCIRDLLLTSGARMVDARTRVACRARLNQGQTTALAKSLG